MKTVHFTLEEIIMPHKGKGDMPYKEKPGHKRKPMKKKKPAKRSPFKNGNGKGY